MTSPAKSPEAGEKFHFLVTGFTFLESGRGSAGMVSRRGQELTITEDMIEANRDRLGTSWLDVLHDSDGQLARWGQAVAAPGPFPPGALPTTPGELEHEDARRTAVRAARSIGDEAQRNEALRKVERDFGPAAPTSRTLAQYTR